jgi:pyruvate,water dikinase
VCCNLGPDAAATLLQRPVAIAATTGGPLSHAAIVARELGIPCVTALPKHLLTLPDGTELTIDGLTGTLQHGTAPPAGSALAPIQISGAAGATVATWPGHPAADDGRAATLIVMDADTDPAP